MFALRSQGKPSHSIERFPANGINPHMRTKEECLKQAEDLERLADDEADRHRRSAYRQMAESWREAAELRSPTHQSEC